MTAYRCETIARGLAFPEAPRWHAGRLWFTDQHARAILAMDPAGHLETIAPTVDLPGGLGWLPDGRVLIVFMTQRRVMQLSGEGIVAYADLSAMASFHCNDMVVDGAGRAYVGNFGFDLHGGDEITPAEIIRIASDGSSEVFARDVVFPNGSVITPPGDTLLVAETFAHRISSFGLDARGRMTSRRLWAGLGEHTPDGICMDVDGALWVASPVTGTLMRVKQGGTILDWCRTRGTPYACMLGGDDRRTLYVCTSETDDPREAAKRKSAESSRPGSPSPVRDCHEAEIQTR
jgi:sugar lactone lactonase YvrE